MSNYYQNLRRSLNAKNIENPIYKTFYYLIVNLQFYFWVSKNKIFFYFIFFNTKDTHYHWSERKHQF